MVDSGQQAFRRFMLRKFHSIAKALSALAADTSHAQPPPFFRLQAVIGKLKVIKLQILTHMPQKMVGSRIL